MKSELLVNPTEFGIEEKQASDLIANLPQLKEERSVLEFQYNEVIKLDIEDMETSKKARELRLKIRDNRTKGIQQWHKATKDYFLKGGQFVDAIKRMEVEINQRMEDNLEQIEKYAEIKEQRRIEALRIERSSKLEKYAEFVPFGIDLGVMDDKEFQKLCNGAKLQYDAKIEAERKAEEERIKEQKRQELINTNRNTLLPWSQFIEKFSEIDFEVANVELLIKEAKEKKEEAEKEAERVRLENEKLKKEAAEKEKKRQAEEKARLEKERIEREKQEAILKAEREAKAKLQAELQAKKDAEAKAERERIEAEKQARIEAERKAKAPIKEKMTDWVNSFEIGSSPIENETTAEIQAKFTAFKKWAQTQINNI